MRLGDIDCSEIVTMVSGVCIGGGERDKLKLMADLLILADEHTVQSSVQAVGRNSPKPSVWLLIKVGALYLIFKD